MVRKKKFFIFFLFSHPGGSVSLPGVRESGHITRRLPDDLGVFTCMWFVIGLFETLICAIAEDKVCDSCIVSSWALLIFLLCLWWPNSNFLCCVVAQNGESSCDLLLSVTNRKALAGGGVWGWGGSAPRAPFKVAFYQCFSIDNNVNISSPCSKTVHTKFTKPLSF